MKTYYVYMMASETGTLYTGITSNLKRRIFEHKTKAIPGFSCRYNVTKLIYIETFKTPDAAIKREKQIKSWRREKKINLIDSKNPAWDDRAVRVIWSRLRRLRNRFLRFGTQHLCCIPSVGMTGVKFEMAK